MNASSVGLPGQLESSVTRKQAHRSSSLLINSEPLSSRIVFGEPISKYRVQSYQRHRCCENAVVSQSLVTAG
jgi:hypothetical protein